MIPTKLRLKGFLSYQQETTLDFSTLHVACISGMNGAGKSSLLDAITWSLFGEARQRNDAIINLNSDEVFVELEFTYENNQYKIHRARQKEKSTQLDFYIFANQDWKSLTERTIKDTQDLITHTLNMDYDTFINASFFLQGKSDQFAKQTPGKRKEILTKILGLEKWEAYKTQALQQRRELEQQKRINDSRIEEKELELAREETYKTTLQTLQEQKEQLEKQLTQQESLLKLLQEQQKQVEQIETQIQSKQKTLEQLTKTKQTLAQKIASKQEQLNRNQTIFDEKEIIQQKISELTQLQEQEKQLAATNIQINQLKEQKHKLELQYSQKKEAINTQIALLNDQLKNYARNQELIENNNSQISELEKNIDSLQSQITDLSTLQTEKSTIEESITNKLAENKNLRTTMDDLQAHIAEIETLSSPTCPFCEQDLTPEHQTKIIQENQTKGKQLGDQFRENKTAIERLKEDLEKVIQNIQLNQESLQKITLFEQNKNQLSKQNQELKKQITQDPAQQLADLQSQLEQNSFAPELKQQLEQVEQNINVYQYSPSHHQEVQTQIQSLHAYQAKNQTLQIAIATQAEIQSSLKELETQNDQLTTQIEQIEQEIAQLKTALSAHLQEEQNNIPIQQKINQIQTEIKTIKQTTYDNQLALGGANQALNNLTQIKAQKTELEQQTTTILTQIASLKEIEKAFSKEGIPALLIEQAIPEIENRANEILRKLTNDEMTISLITQEEYKDKKREDLKETMEIKIHDKFGTRDYELFSGGETFRINFALRLALSELLSKRAGAKLQTLVIDEGFGSQDQFGRQKLAEVINPIKEQFALILVITHIDSLKDAFPNRILVEKTPQGSIAQIA